RLIFLIVYLAYCSIYIARVNLSVANPMLLSENIMDAVQIGLLGSVFSVIYAGGRLLNGTLSDIKPPWLMITVGLAAAGISNILIGFFPPFLGIFMLWAVNAYAQSMLWSSVLCIVSNMYDQRTAKKKTSLMVTSVAAGNILGILINTWVITELGLTFAFVVPGALTLVLGLAVMVTTRHIDPPHGEKRHLSIFGLLKEKQLRLMCIPALMHGVMKENISLWMVVFIIDQFHIDLQVSAAFVLFIPAVGFVGRLLYPLCYKLCKEKENRVSVFGFGICILCSVLLCFTAASPILAVLYLSLIYTAVSMINTSMLSIYPIRYLDSGNVASVSGIMDFATYLGGGISSVLYGLLIDGFGYVPMFASWVIISVVSIFFLKRD
ncbi:MAG: MFS transporter, partial [Firmicutes bacterium]|nr:MFS transporter [Bacillota bacterium]